MDVIEIVSFRSTFEGGRAMLAAELSPRPADRWRALCVTNLARFENGFAQTPELLVDAIVVSTTAHEVGIAESALKTVVEVTNQLAAEEAIDPS
jgi:hypothetical protein